MSESSQPMCSVCAPAPGVEEPCLRCAILWLVSPELEELSAHGSVLEDAERAWSAFVERTREDLASRVPCAGCGFRTRDLHAGVPLCAQCRAAVQAQSS